MQKEDFSTLALVAFLVILIIAAVYIRKEQELLARKPDLQTIVSNFLGQTQAADATVGGQVCPAGCTSTSTSTTATPTPKPTADDKEAWRADPATRVSTVLRQKFAKEILAGDLEQNDFIQDQMWWRSPDEGYRILVSPAKTTGYQVQTTEIAAELTPKNAKDLHPAAKHPVLKKVIKAINKEMSSLGYKKSNFSSCPVSEAYDSFNNCLATYTRDDHKCTLMAGYGRLDRQVSTTPYLRLELSCSDAYDTAYQAARPYLYTLNLINPEWRVPDMAVENVYTFGDWSRVNFSGGNYGIFQKVDSGYRLASGGNRPVTCLTAATAEIPQEIYQNCL